MSILRYLDKLAAFAARRGFIAGVTRYPIGTFPEATQGRVAGVAKPLDGGVLEAPLSGRSCVYYQVELLAPAGDKNVQIAVEQRGLPFLLEDETGQAVIDPAHAQILCSVDRQGYARSADGADVRKRALLKRFSLMDRDWQDSATHFQEAIIAIGERITVVGMGMRVLEPASLPGPEHGYRESRMTTRMYFASTARHRLILSDDPKHQKRGE